MFTIRKATLADIEVIRTLAAQTFPATYQHILTPEQIGGYGFVSLAEDLRTPLLPEIQTRTATVPAGYKGHQGTSSGTLPHGTECEPTESCTWIL